VLDGQRLCRAARHVRLCGRAADYPPHTAGNGPDQELICAACATADDRCNDDREAVLWECSRVRRQ
jgi:hypothetical protein